MDYLHRQPVPSRKQIQSNSRLHFPVSHANTESSLPAIAHPARASPEDEAGGTLHNPQSTSRRRHRAQDMPANDTNHWGHVAAALIYFESDPTADADHRLPASRMSPGFPAAQRA